jgi:phosphohistidine swiveling domain-containing protein
MPDSAAQLRLKDPTNCAACAADVAWSTINAGEAIPGVVTPLTWSFFGEATDRAIKQTFANIGAISQEEVRNEPDVEHRMWDVFYGRAAANLNLFRRVGDGIPGTSGDAIEEQLFGQVRPGVKSIPRRGRYPIAAVKMPYAAVKMGEALRREVGPVGPFWQASVRPGGMPDPARARFALREAHRRFEAVMVPHTLAAMLCQGLYDQLHRAAERAGLPGLELRLVTGYGQMAETDVVSDLWHVSRDRLTMDEFVARHGYHGPNEGELSARVWRLDRQPLVDLLDAYRAQSEDHDPRAIERVRGEERARAEQELLSALSGPRRALTERLMKIAAALIPLRGTGKAAFLQCVDVAREAARVIGADLSGRGVIERPEDAFMLTLEELLDPGLGASVATALAGRRELHQRYLTLDIPDLFYGTPEPLALSEIAEDHAIGEPITGVAVSPGLVQGRARIVLDPLADDPMEPGEILVCRTTDPSWASAMMVASALVIDIGGAISHGAIVARELGIPCAIGTRYATKRIRTGDLIEVDGAKGEVRILERAAVAEARSGSSEPDQPTTRRGGTSMDSADQLALLRAIRLKGRASAEDAASASGIADAEGLVLELLTAGLLKAMRGAYVVTPEGREVLDGLLADERARADEPAVLAAYEAFTPINDQFKALASDWQSREGEVNDHADASYDAEVMGRLPAIHTQVSAIVADLAAQAPRLAVYDTRLATAAEKVAGGDSDWLLKPLIDSYHTVWFELHEELISLAGRTRIEEAAAGRAH